MTVIEGTGGPIRFIRFAGPAVEALENRKEPGHPDPVTDAELRSNWERLGPSICAALRALVEAYQPSPSSTG